jgi:hypothetical protein
MSNIVSINGINALYPIANQLKIELEDETEKEIIIRFIRHIIETDIKNYLTNQKNRKSTSQ